MSASSRRTLERYANLCQAILIAIVISLPTPASGASVPFSGYVNGSGAGYAIAPGRRVIFGASLAVSMEKRAHTGRDSVYITAENLSDGRTIYRKRFDWGTNRKIVIIDGFDIGKSNIRLCVNSAKLSRKDCYSLVVVRVKEPVSS